MTTYRTYQRRRILPVRRSAERQSHLDCLCVVAATCLLAACASQPSVKSVKHPPVKQPSVSFSQLEPQETATNPITPEQRVTLPRLLHHPLPIFPASAVLAPGHTVVVQAKLSVDASGHVYGVSLSLPKAQATDYSLFADSVRSTVSHWTFSPYRIETYSGSYFGRLVKTETPAFSMSYAFKFQIMHGHRSTEIEN